MGGVGFAIAHEGGILAEEAWVGGVGYGRPQVGGAAFCSPRLGYAPTGTMFSLTVKIVPLS